jgi:ATP-dependent Zn protease
MKPQSRKAGRARQSTISRRSVAIHEAGHAVLGLFLRLPIAKVTIEPNEALGALGHTIYSGAWLATVIEAFDGDGGIDAEIATGVRAVMVGMAGKLAEEVIVGHASHARHYDHDENGISEIVSRVCIGADEGDAFCAWLAVRTRRLVTVRRREIETVADALLARGTLSDEEVDSLLFPRPKSKL